MTMKPWFLGVSALGAMSMGFFTKDIRPVVNPAIKQVGLHAHDTHAATSLLGQFRTSLSASLFLRADLYLHNGVEMRPLSDAEVKAGKQGVGGSSAEKIKLHDDSKIITVIPPSSQDFRGLLGDVERSVTTYKNMVGHTHQTPTQTLPLFRLMTILDPQFVQGWTTGGFILLWDQKPGCLEKSIAFLQEGLRNNPKSIDILTQIAYCHLKVLPKSNKLTRDYRAALTYIVAAREIGKDNFDILTEQELDALKQNYWRMVICFREINDYKQMLRAAREGAAMYPDDAVLARHVVEAERLCAGKFTEVAPVIISEPTDSDL